jgi:DNA-binding LacI/PurR family transcriptional regulator
MRINLVDVAEGARVSTVTASRAFSNPSLLAPKTRTRVLQVAERLGYVPNRLARSLRNGKTQTIAVLTTDLQQRLNTLKLDMLQREITRCGYHTLLLQYGYEEGGAMSLLAECRDTIDALILCCLEGGPSVNDIRRLLGATIPVVSLEHFSGLALDVVTADREFGSHLAVGHLVRLGHTRIALGQIALNSDAVGKRALGYQCAMQAAGLEPVVLSSPAGGPSAFETGYSMAMNSDVRGPRPTAWLFSDDELAVGAMKAFAEQGLNVPEDVAVVGWDDSPLCDYTRPSLTSITQPVQSCVRLLVERLLEALEGSDAPAQVTLIRPELVVRESCGTRLNRSSSASGAHAGTTAPLGL